MISKVDLDLTEDGDLALDNGDLALARGKDCFQDDLIIRIKTQNPDWYHYPRIGADLDTLVGEPNTRETGELGVRLIREALSRYGLVPTGNMVVTPIPVSMHEIIFYIVIHDNQDLRVAIKYNYESGVEEVRLYDS